MGGGPHPEHVKLLQTALHHLLVGALSSHLLIESLDADVGGATVDALMGGIRQLQQMVTGVLQAVEAPSKDAAALAAQTVRKSSDIVFRRLRGKLLYVADVDASQQLQRLVQQTNLLLFELVRQAEALHLAYAQPDRAVQLAAAEELRTTVQSTSLLLRTILQNLYVLESADSTAREHTPAVFAAAAARLVAALPADSSTAQSMWQPLYAFRNVLLIDFAQRLQVLIESSRKVVAAMAAPAVAQNAAAALKLSASLFALVDPLLASMQDVFTRCVVQTHMDNLRIAAHHLLGSVSTWRLVAALQLLGLQLQGIPSIATAGSAYVDSLVSFIHSVFEVSSCTHWG